MPKGNEVISLFALEQKANELILMLHVGWREAGEKPHATHVEGEEQNNTPPPPPQLLLQFQPQLQSNSARSHIIEPAFDLREKSLMWKCIRIKSQNAGKK